MITERELALYDFWESVSQDNCTLVKDKLKSIDLNAADKWGRTALHKAVLYCSYNSLDLLISNPKLEINARDKSGRTAFDLASECNDKNARETILQIFRKSLLTKEL